MVLRVTFDTNVLDYACRPDRFPKDPRQPGLQKVRDALSVGDLEGFFSITMLTIEGIMRRDRAEVFAGTTLEAQSESTSVDTVNNASSEIVELTYRVNQPDRRPLSAPVVDRVKAARALGVRALKGIPRVGAYDITDASGTLYLPNDDAVSRDTWIATALDVARAIEARGLGFAQVQSLGRNMAAGDPAKAWFKALDNANDVHEERAVERAFSEWADGDSIAAHVAYGIDVFCSNDVGNSNATNSVLDPDNRAWLNATYGVTFMTFDDLLAELP